MCLWHYRFSCCNNLLSSFLVSLSKGIQDFSSHHCPTTGDTETIPKHWISFYSLSLPKEKVWAGPSVLICCAWHCWISDCSSRWTVFSVAARHPKYAGSVSVPDRARWKGVPQADPWKARTLDLCSTLSFPREKARTELLSWTRLCWLGRCAVQVDMKLLFTCFSRTIPDLNLPATSELVSGVLTRSFVLYMVVKLVSRWGESVLGPPIPLPWWGH